MDEVNDILQTIDDITAQNPNLPVFQDLHKTYTYADLSDESNRIANFLLDH